MFGIDDALIWGPMIGAALGGVASKKDPLQGALLGAGLGAAGGAVAPGLLGTGAATGAATAAAPAASFPGITGLTTGGIAGGVGDVGLAELTGSGAVLNGVAKAPTALDTALGYGKQLSQAAGAANSVKSMFEPQQTPIQASPVIQNQPNNQLGQLVQSMGQEQQAQQQIEQQKREARQKMIRGLL